MAREWPKEWPRENGQGEWPRGNGKGMARARPVASRAQQLPGSSSRAEQSPICPTMLQSRAVTSHERHCLSQGQPQLPESTARAAEGLGGLSQLPAPTGAILSRESQRCWQVPVTELRCLSQREHFHLFHLPMEASLNQDGSVPQSLQQSAPKSPGQHSKAPQNTCTHEEPCGQSHPLGWASPVLATLSKGETHLG